MSEAYDVVIIGAGPAGLTAGLYCSQAGLRTLALERETLGGKVVNTDKIENYPGFGEGVSGAELGAQMLLQAAQFGLAIELAAVVASADSAPGRWNADTVAARLAGTGLQRCFALAVSVGIAAGSATSVV